MYIYIYIYMYTHIYIHTHTHTHIHTYIHTYILAPATLEVSAETGLLQLRTRVAWQVLSLLALMVPMYKY